MQDNHIQYIELSSTDFTKTKAFYRNVFGWSFTDYGDDYIAFQDSGVDGGFVKVDAITKGSPLVILYHSNLEQALEKVKNAGGTISKEIFSFPGGRRFHFTDPSGNERAVWSDK